MTIEQAKSKYGYKESIGAIKVGYVPCYDCPCNGDDEKCPKGCTGYDDAWEAIVKYFSQETEEDTTAHDNPVSHPSHYTQGGIECIDAMESAFGKEAVENFCLCNAFKYVWRNKHKNGLEDIDKAIWYLNKFKELCKDE
jgi:hypothetical protein